jgi:murein DD-endopeptidase MepM/ murein hydrolase activator NlpD
MTANPLLAPPRRPNLPPHHPPPRRRTARIPPALVPPPPVSGRADSPRPPRPPAVHVAALLLALVLLALAVARCTTVPSPTALARAAALVAHPQPPHGPRPGKHWTARPAAPPLRSSTPHPSTRPDSFFDARSPARASVPRDPWPSHRPPTPSGFPTSPGHTTDFDLSPSHAPGSRSWTQPQNATWSEPVAPRRSPSMCRPETPPRPRRAAWSALSALSCAASSSQLTTSPRPELAAGPEPLALSRATSSFHLATPPRPLPVNESPTPLRSGTPISPAPPRRTLAESPWTWPLPGYRDIARPYEPPPAPWASGHRGIDIAAPTGTPVLAAGPGTVTYAAILAGRGVIVVLHTNGLRTTYEPVSATVRVGQPVNAGDPLGTLSPGHPGCPQPACLHLGLRRGGDYLDPTTLFATGPIRLLPLTDAPPPSGPLPASSVAAQPPSRTWTPSPAAAVPAALVLALAASAAAAARPRIP